MQQPITFLMRGGLDLVTPPIAVPPGRALAAENFEADASGYRRIDGYRRYDGSEGRPPLALALGGEMLTEDGAGLALLTGNEAIGGVPGVGPVRGVHIYRNQVFAFRDQETGEGGMFRATTSGWERLSFGHVLFFTDGTVAFTEGRVVSGGTSGATATIQRVAIRRGSYSAGDAEGYLVVTILSGAFQPGEAITDDVVGDAEAGLVEAVQLRPGGRYRFVNHNFFGLSGREAMYFCNGQQHAFEFDSGTLSPIIVAVGANDTVSSSYLRTRSGGFVTTRLGARLTLRSDRDYPMYVSELSNHLLLAFGVGTLVFSGIGNPLDWRTSAGAGEIAVRDEPTGFIRGASGSLVVFGRSRVSYLVGTSAQDFRLDVITDSSGAVPDTIGTADAPFYMDAGGVRRLNTTSAFGNWRIGTVTELIEPLIAANRRAMLPPAATIVSRSKDQYRLYYQDGSGISIYFGVQQPEAMPFRLPVPVCCATTGAIDGRERSFIAGATGYVYEVDAGESADGQPIPAWLRLGWNAIDRPNQKKRFHAARLEMSAEQGASISVSFMADYGSLSSVAGHAAAETAARGHEMPAQVEQGVAHVPINNVGRNLGIQVASVGGAPYTLTAVTLYVTPRRLSR